MPRSLELTTYSPNLKDPRVRRRLEQVIGYCEPMVEFDIERPIMAKALRRLIGNYSSATAKPNQLAIWLYSNLFRQVLFYQVGKVPYSYTVKPEGLAKIKALLAAG